MGDALEVQVENNRFDRRMVQLAMVIDLVLLVEALALANACFSLMRARYTAETDAMSPWIVPFLRRSYTTSAEFSPGAFSPPRSYQERFRAAEQQGRPDSAQYRAD